MAITAQKGDNNALRTFKNIKIFSNRHILRAIFAISHPLFTHKYLSLFPFSAPKEPISHLTNQ